MENRFTGTVVRATGSWYDVLHDGAVVRCRIRGRLRLRGVRSTNPVVVGDEVTCEADAGGDYVICDISPRRNYVIRRASNLSKESHIIAANVDQALLMATLRSPETATEFVDRFLVTCEAYKVPVTILLSKLDLQDAEAVAEFRAVYEGNWTAKHVKWLRSLKPTGLYKEILDEYLLTYTILTDKLNRLDQRIEELASKEEYKESVSKLTCFLGIKIHTALSVIVEVGDFQRFVSARKFAGYLGLVPGQHSSGDDRNGLGITKAGNTHVRRLLVESAQSYTRGKIGYKSRVLRSRQAGNSPQIINYADRANERLRRRYYQMVLKDGKKYNIAKIAVARELACFIWGMMTDNIY